MRKRGTPFHGVLYAGLMLTADGPRVLEFNVRFGDPETQAVLPRLRSDLLELLLAATRLGGLQGMSLEWTEEWAVTLVLASAGYPASSSSGDVIHGLEQVPAGIEVTHAGTASASRRSRHRRRSRAERHRARAERGISPNGGVCCRSEDLLRWNATAARHRRQRRTRGHDNHMSDTAPTPIRTDLAQAEVQAQLEEFDVEGPLVGIVMGSESDMEAMEKAAKELHARGIPHEIQVMSAHREADIVAEYAKGAKSRGLRVLIAGAGISAALPGAVAAHTDLPVIGVPLSGRLTAAGGLDAILSIVQMPPGVPVACVGLDNARNAAILAAQIIAA